MRDEIKKAIENRVTKFLSDKKEEQIDSMFKSYQLGPSLENTSGGVVFRAEAHNEKSSLEKAYGKLLNKEEVEYAKSSLMKSLFYQLEVAKQEDSKKSGKDKKRDVLWDLQFLVDRLCSLRDNWRHKDNIIEEDVPELKEVLEAAYKDIIKEIKSKIKEYNKI